MTELVARYKPGENIPVFAGSLIAAGHFVKITGAKTANNDYPAAHCSTGDWTFGVAELDSAPTSFPATASDRRVNVVHGGGAIARVVAGAAVTVLDEVQSDATGRAITQTTGLALGKALTEALAAGDIIEVELYGTPSKGVPGTGNAFIEGTQQAHVADPTLTGAASTPSTASLVGGNTATGTQINTAITGVIADVAALAADVADLYTSLTSTNAKVAAHNDTLEEYGQQALV